MAQGFGKEGEGKPKREKPTKEGSMKPEINLIYATGVPAWIARGSQRYKEDAEGFMFMFPAEAAS